MRAALALCGAAAAAGAAPEWQQLFTPPLFTDNPIPLMFGLSCKAKSDCVVAGGTPNTGMSVYKVRDDFFRTVHREKVNSPIPLTMLLSIAETDKDHAVAAGLGLLIGGTFWTKDGRNYNASLELGVLTSQDVKVLPATWPQAGYAFVGQSGKKMGPAISHDGGVTFKWHPWPADLAPEAPARYGAFPTATTWYVTGGEWPQDSAADRADYHYVSRRMRVHRTSGRVEHIEMAGVAAREGASPAGYTGVITKTTDGGQTWEVQYNSSGKFYFNQVDCASENVCIAVGEGFEKDGSTAPGAHILMTTDGKTWKEVYVFGATGEEGSVMTVNMLSEQEAWVGASWSKSMLEKGGVMLHTTDGGETWDQSPTLSGIGTFTAATFIDDGTAYACGATFSQLTTVVCLGCGTPPAPAPGTGSFTQDQCTDANCTEGCKEAAFAQGQCLQTSSGGSAKVTCSDDAKTLETKEYKSTDCTGSAQTKSEPTQQCLKSSSGGYFENICPGGSARVAAAQAGSAAVLRV